MLSPPSMCCAGSLSHASPWDVNSRPVGIFTPSFPDKSHREIPGAEKVFSKQCFKQTSGKTFYWRMAISLIRLYVCSQWSESLVCSSGIWNMKMLHFAKTVVIFFQSYLLCVETFFLGEFSWSVTTESSTIFLPSLDWDNNREGPLGTFISLAAHSQR